MLSPGGRSISCSRNRRRNLANRTILAPNGSSRCARRHQAHQRIVTIQGTPPPGARQSPDRLPSGEEPCEPPKEAGATSSAVDPKTCAWARLLRAVLGRESGGRRLGFRVAHLRGAARTVPALSQFSE